MLLVHVHTLTCKHIRTYPPAHTHLYVCRTVSETTKTLPGTCSKPRCAADAAASSRTLGRTRTHARTHSATVCVCIYRVRTHMAPQTHTRNRTQYDVEDAADDKPSEDEHEDEVSERLGRAARRVSLRA